MMELTAYSIEGTAKDKLFHPQNHITGFLMEPKDENRCTYAISYRTYTNLISKDNNY